MKKLILAVTILFLIVGCQPGNDQEPTIHYDVQFPNVVHNEAEITLILDNILPGPITISMSRTSPGRYALHEFSKNVYDVTATDENGDTLQITRSDLHNWTIQEHEGTVNFSYTLYGNHADGTYTGINEQHAHLNMPASFAWVRGLSGRPVTVKFHPPEESNWKVATQLQSTDEEFTYRAPTYHYFLDSPTELSNFDLREWQTPADTADQKIRLALHHNGSDEDLDRFTEMAKKVVTEQVAVYGTPADFDYDTYTFITDYLPYVYGDGMEHRNSTILTSQTPLEDDGAQQNLFTLSHEFFHSWNVERLRPASLEPFNFMAANVSGALWFAEGFTSYYDDLTIRRAGITTNEEYASDWAGTLNYVLNSPGNKYYSPIGMSEQAPFVDAASSVDAQNKSNTFISYYSWGAVLGLSLDLSLRSTFEEVTLDDYMRTVWEKYGKTENPYNISGLEETLAEVTDSTEFAENFFNKHIRNGQHMDLQPLLAKAGFVLQKANPDGAVISLASSIIDYEEEAIITGNTQVGSPLYQAGLNDGDIIESINGQSINNEEDMQQLLTSHQPGDELRISYTSLDETYEGTVTLVEDPALEVLTFEEAGKALTEEIKQFRQNWLGSKANDDQENLTKK